MNKVILMGRLTKDPDIRYSQNENATCVARYTLAVDRKFKKDGEPTADFFPCVAFGKNGEFAEKYLRKGTKILIEGHLQCGQYEDKDGKTVYTKDVIVEGHEFCESKGSNTPESNVQTDAYGFMNVPDSIEDELPFN